MPASQDETINDIVSRLESISEEIADKALDALKSAHRDGAARRSIENAIGVLTRLD